jgi:hypothetical protein
VPAAPHDETDSDANGSHAPELQHPAQDEPPHEQAPPEHASPDPHAQHACPPAPHALFDWPLPVKQVLPLQHPVGQDVASHMHPPPVALHSCPVAHAAQVAPATPQDVAVSAAKSSHLPVAPPLQQPPGQVVALQPQTPEVVSHPFGHAAHAAPPIPHWAADSEAYGTQTPALQHPCGQEAASHTHWPELLHSVPAAHAAQATPAVPQDLFACCAYGSHAPLSVQHPSGQECESHTHCPLPAHS